MCKCHLMRQSSRIIEAFVISLIFLEVVWLTSSEDASPLPSVYTFCLFYEGYRGKSSSAT